MPKRIYTKQSSERDATVQILCIQDCRCKFALQNEVNNALVSRGYKHLLVLGLVEHIGKAALAAVLKRELIYCCFQIEYF